MKHGVEAGPDDAALPPVEGQVGIVALGVDIALSAEGEAVARVESADRPGAEL